MPQEPLTPTSIEELPDEIIDKIFALIYQMYNDHDQISFLGTLDSHDFPWNVASVSKSWRSIVLSRPMFWSTIDLNLDEYYTTRHEWIIPVERMVRLMLERSTSAPLTIGFRDHPSLDSSGLAKDIMVLLIEHAERWAEVALGISFELFDALDGVRNRLPILSKLALEPYGAQTFDEFTTFEIAPRLESVTLKNVDNIEPYRFPTQQLKALKGPVYLGYKLAEQCPLLEDCEMGYTGSALTFPGNVRNSSISFERPNLHRLVTNAVFLTPTFRFPSLKTLVCYHKETGNTIYDINRFIERNQCSLNRLLISGFFGWDYDWGDSDPIHRFFDDYDPVIRLSGDPDPILRLFELVPQLTYLGITEDNASYPTPWEDLAYHLMAPDDSTQPLVPNLDEIAFLARRNVSKGTANKLEELGASRCRYRGTFRAKLIGFH